MVSALSPILGKVSVDLLERDGKWGGLVISSSFVGMTQVERQDFIWDILSSELFFHEMEQILGLITLTPEESSEADNDLDYLQG